MRGMATAAEAETILGVTRLRKVADIVRPDLHGKHASTAAPSRESVAPPRWPRRHTTDSAVRTARAPGAARPRLLERTTRE